MVMPQQAFYTFTGIAGIVRTGSKDKGSGHLKGLYISKIGKRLILILIKTALKNIKYCSKRH
jgi:hypothetical protein